MKNQNILKKNFEFQKIIQKKYFIQNTSFVVYVDKQSNDFKYGISVGKKNGNAVKRNKIKRQVRAMVYEIIQGNIARKRNIVIIVKKKYMELPYLENFKYLICCFNLIK